MTDYDKRQAVKRKLGSYRAIKREQEQLEQELDKLEAAMTAPRIQALDGMPKGGGKHDPMLAFIEQHLALEDRYKLNLLQLAAAQAEIETMIESLDSTERQLARYRYIDGLTWEEVCVALHYEWAQTHRIHGRLLDQLAGGQYATD